MAFAAGALLTALFFLLLIPALVARTERLVKRRIISTVPTMQRELAARHDGLIAQYTVALCAAEMRCNSASSKYVAEAAVASRQKNSINLLTSELRECRRQISAFEKETIRNNNYLREFEKAMRIEAERNGTLEKVLLNKDELINAQARELAACQNQVSALLANDTE